MTSPPRSRPVVSEPLLERVRSELASTSEPVTPARVAAVLRAEGAVLGDAAVLEVTEAVRAEITGAGPLEPLLREESVTDVMVNGPNEVWVDRGTGPQQCALTFRDEAAVRRLAQRLASAAGRRLDEAVPYVDGRLPDGVRLHAVIPPIAASGTAISLRVPARRMFGLSDLTACGSVPESLVPWLTAVVNARLAFLVSGSTGTGKTTVLAALLGLVPAHERIVLIEESRELTPAHDHVVRLECRAANVEGAGYIGLDLLVRQALRMRPDRIVVGEVRGAEMVDMLAALNTGHEGGCATVHANSAAEVPARLEALGIAAGMSRDAVHAQAAAALDVVVHLTRSRTGQRRLADIGIMRRTAAGQLDIQPALSVRHNGDIVHGPGKDELQRSLADRGWAP